MYEIYIIKPVLFKSEVLNPESKRCLKIMSSLLGKGSLVFNIFTKASVTLLNGSNKPMDCQFQFTSPVLMFFLNMDKSRVMKYMRQ